jgi:L-iditol 2-dehydrogenase
MKVAMYYNNNDIRLEEMPIPEINEDELLLKVIASGICGSDVMEWYRAKKAPRVLGHEVSGVIEKAGKKVKKFKKGDRIVVTHHVPCGTCRFCEQGKETVCETLRKTNFNPGGFSEYLRVPKINVEKGTFKIPKGVSFEEGTFVEPLGCAVRGQRIADIKKGQIVLILGSGISGLLHIKLAKVKGAKVIATDINDFRIKFAEKAGADLAINAKELTPGKFAELNGDRLADRVIVSTGAVPAISQAFGLVEAGGTILFFAPTEPGKEISIPFNEMWFKGVTLTTTYAAAKKDLEEAIELIKKKKVSVKDMVTHRLSLSETQKGFELVSKAEKSMKVIIEPGK